MTHLHNADPSKGAVCSHLVTDAAFLGWGLVTKQTDKIMGTPVVTRPGISHRDAMMTAWGRGHVRICTVVTGHQSNHVTDPVWTAAALDWVAAHKVDLVRA